MLALGIGTDNIVNALVIYGGILYAGGEFITASTTVPSVPVNYVAGWDGSRWLGLGAGMNNGVYALAVDRRGNLYAGGWFTWAGGQSSPYIARWFSPASQFLPMILR